MTDLLGRLDTVQPADLAALRIVRETDRLARAGELTLDKLLTIQPEIDDAMTELDNHRIDSQRIIRSCQSLRPRPSKTPPLGL